MTTETVTLTQNN